MGGDVHVATDTARMGPPTNPQIVDRLRDRDRSGGPVAPEIVAALEVACG